MMLFALNASAALGSRLGKELGCKVSPHEEREFACGEHKARPLVSVWGEDVYVLSSLHGDCDYSVNDKICRLLFFIGALKDAGASRVTAAIPYLAYSRKDRRTKPSDPVATRYVATILQSVGTDRIITMDVHNLAAFENSFACPSINLTTFDLFAAHFYRAAGENVNTIVSPDLGGIKPTRQFLEAYSELSHHSPNLAIMDKKRSEGKVSGTGLIGDIGNHVLILDDMIGGGSTLCRAVTACIEAGAHDVSVGATHGLFENGAPALFKQEGIGEIVVSDSVAIENLGLGDEQLGRVTILGTAGLLADCIREMQG